MTKSPKDLALSYIANNVPVFPCRDADEVTDRYDPETGEFEVLKAKTPLVSNGFKGATKHVRNVNILWDRNPTAMVGAPTGEQMGAWVLDVDVHKGEDGNIINGYETIAALEAKYEPLPHTATAKTAGGGEHRYFKYIPGVRNRGKLGFGLDIRGSGGYVIMPGSITAEGNEYVWVDYDGEGIPPVADAPDWLLELVLPPPATHTNSNYVYESGANDAYVDRAIQLELEETASVPMGAGRNNRLFAAAAALGGFVGAGALAESEARAMLQDVARGWGRDWAKCCKTIDNGLEAGIKQPREIPERTFRDDGTQPIDTTLMMATTKAKKATAPTVEHPAPQHPAHPEEDEPPEYKLEAVADLESLTYPGGLLEDLIDWIVSSAEQPSRALAMAAVLPLVASLCGPRYSTGSRDTRPNIYTVALADSGFGKEHARSQIKRLLMSDHGIFENYSGPARIMSASALREVLEANQSVNCQIDEFGGFVRDITDRKAGSHQRAISTDLRDYYSASSTFFEGAAYRGSPPKRIYNPNLCVHGTSTPEQFWSALSSASAEDGLLPRLILFHVTGKKPPVVVPAQDVRRVPHTLLMRMADVAGIDVAKKRGNLRGYKIETTSEEIKPTVVPWSEDAKGILRAVKETIEAKESAVAAESQPFVRRIIENAIKLALIAAVGTDPKQPVITEAIFEWAAAVAWTCAAAMLAEVGERLADNQREANYKKIQGLIKKAGALGVTEGRLLDRCKAIEAWQREDIIKDLVSGGRVVVPANDNKKSGPKSKRYLWVD
ncbi:bifunctional DNA primase/polymerase [Rhizobium leucaenae]|uniref:bifunctional DNA primase/polymerase n=1 Tax=Rhizobium leucaenae TaxID=29450 RepID=UPI0003FD203E|nr:bifunctional DNA primase/polymerase [Rhizobium leucaenae]